MPNPQALAPPLGLTRRHAGLVIFLMILAILACSQETQPQATPPDRESLIPESQVKISPETDVHPVVAVTDEYEDPVPLPYPVNTAGAEDSAFIMPDGNTLYVWFTPDVSKPVEKQVVDGVTGIYVTHKQNGTWSEPERVLLEEPGKAVGDGCEFVLGDVMWFCTVREGLTGIHWFTAELIEGVWQNWQQADFDPAYEVGELHITSDGGELYFHSPRSGGKGGYDIWVSAKMGGEWQEPRSVEVVNTELSEGWPFISQDGSELWFTRAVGAPELWRSKLVDGQWSTPELMFRNFAGESSMDLEGNLYFTHHFFKDDQMLEADIYFAKKK